MLLTKPSAFAQSIPRPVGYVNDFASIIDADVESQLDAILRQYEEETTVELVVVTVPNLDGTTVEDFAVRLFEAWGIGKKGVDNGVLLLVARDEREVRIEVGYGMEPYLTDGQAGRILDAEVLPDFRSGDYTLGILKGITAIAEAIVDNGYEPGSVRPRSEVKTIVDRFRDRLGLLAMLGFASIYVLSFMARTREVVLGTVWGAAVGGVLGWLAGGVVLIIVGVVVLALVGFALDAALSSAYRYQSRTGRPTSWHRTWGGFSGTGRGGGPRFPGFGGGRSGGGGASRRF